MTDNDGSTSWQLDTTVPHVARVYDYLLGGKNNYPADRAMAETLLETNPGLVAAARANRAFLGRAVHHLAAVEGVRQYLDIGSGLPSAGNTHEVAQDVAPESRIVYVDNDPLVRVHAQALLTSCPEGATDYFEGDVRDPGTILREAARTLDFDRPVALMLLTVLQCVPEQDEAEAVVRTLTDRVPSGSFLVISHGAGDIDDTMTASAAALSREASASMTTRSREQVARLFHGWDLLDPGLTSVSTWRPDSDVPAQRVPVWAGVARKP